jgi:hypothetical protein
MYQILWEPESAGGFAQMDVAHHVPKRLDWSGFGVHGFKDRDISLWMNVYLCHLS